MYNRDDEPELGTVPRAIIKSISADAEAKGFDIPYEFMEHLVHEVLNEVTESIIVCDPCKKAIIHEPYGSIVDEVNDRMYNQDPELLRCPL